MRKRFIAGGFIAAIYIFAADRVFTPYSAVKPVLDAFAAQLPAALKNPNAATWNTWSRQEDRRIRARLDQGDLDSMVNLLLFGTSFTKQPRIEIQALAEASKSGVLRGRVDDLVRGLQSPGSNERLIFLHNLLRDRLETNPGAFIMQNLGEGHVLFEDALQILHDEGTRIGL